MKLLKQCVGIDVSKDTLECCFGSMEHNQEQHFSKAKTFSNDVDGFRALMKWANKQAQCKNVIYLMEATGVYYENLAYWLHENELTVVVLLPNKTNHFAKSHNFKTKTDWVDAQILSMLGLERPLKPWSVTAPILKNIKALAREFRELKSKTTVVKNQMHAKRHSHKPLDSTLRRLKKQVKIYESQLLEVEAEIRVMIMSDSALSDRIEKLQTIPGIGFMTIVTIVAETNGFALIRNAKQLVSYAGLDVQHNQSGNKNGKSRISKKGNGHIRHALYLPAMCASQFNPQLAIFYNRLKELKPVKRVAVTAVARKLLILVFVLWKNNTEFNPDCSF